MSPVTLPTAPQAREANPMDARVVLLGQPKIGKTTLAAAWNPKHTLIIDCEGGTRLLDGEHYVMPVSTFTQFEETVTAITSGQHEYRTLVIDTVDALWKLTDAHVAGRKGQAAAGLIEYGKGVAEAEGLFRREVGKLLATDLGVWFTGHTDVLEVNKVQRYVPTLDKRVRGYVLGACDFVLFAEAQGPSRVLHTAPNERYEAGARVPLPDPLPLNARALFDAITAGMNGGKTNGKTNGKAGGAS